MTSTDEFTDCSCGERIYRAVNGNWYHWNCDGTPTLACTITDNLSPEGIDLYGTRATNSHGQPVHDRCGQPLRWSTAYDEPHWVHTSAADVMACPPLRGSL